MDALTKGPDDLHKLFEIVATSLGHTVVTVKMAQGLDRHIQVGDHVIGWVGQGQARFTG